MTSLRAVSSEDIPALMRIEAAWPTAPHWTLENFRAELAAARSLGTVVEEDGRVLGFVFVWIIADEAQIADIAVDRGAARRGLGRTLLRHALGQARARGCACVTLEVSADNPGALALYQAEGFSVVGRRAKIYNGISDALLMTLRF